MKSPERIILEHGSGGALSRQLTEEMIYPILQNEAYPELADATAFEIRGRTFITTDTYVVDPPFFPGGDIGTLGVFGTCNDLAVCGARARFLSLGLVLEEGFPTADLRRALESVRLACEQSGVLVLSGDTKVVPTGKGGGIFLNTTGIGEALGDHYLSVRNIQSGDAVLVSGPVGNHGLAILAAREGLKIGASLRSDCAPLFPLCEALYGLGRELRFMRDATRGGAAAVLNEAVSHSEEFGLEVDETAFPISGIVAAASDLLGLNPLEIANEGVMIAVVAQRASDEALSLLRSFEAGREACQVGIVSDGYPGRVILETAVGGRRILDLPRGLLLPRIC
ncbi:MAG: hydrogenase expression/formation protein HypE [Spirochaetaceae bacterium]|nr:MAG: hydrogenase expression/formation protein HypE [Spirochaetaceae bacterium]